MTLSTSLQILTVSYKCWQRENHTPLNVAGLSVSTTCMRLCCRFYRLQCLHTSSDPILDMWCQWLLQSRWVLGSLLRVQNTETPKLIFTTTTTPPRTETRQTLLTLFRAIRIKIFFFFFKLNVSGSSSDRNICISALSHSNMLDRECFVGDLPRVRVARAWKPNAKDFSWGLMHLHVEKSGNSSRNWLDNVSHVYNTKQNTFKIS